MEIYVHKNYELINAATNYQNIDDSLSLIISLNLLVAA